MSYNAKNYTEQGGEKTVIGGVLEVKEGASVTGLPAAENQLDSTATTVAGLKDSFNDLLLKLKDAGLMTGDAWSISVAKIAHAPASDPHAEELTANQAAVSAVAITDGVITVTTDVADLVAFPSSNPAQGTHKWVGLTITTGLPDITAIKYNGQLLTTDDVAEAAAVGGTNGDIVLWLKCDEVVNEPKQFKLWSYGYATENLTVTIFTADET